MKAVNSLRYKEKLLTKPERTKRHIGFLIMLAIYLVLITGINQSCDWDLLSWRHISSFSAILFFFISWLGIAGGALTAAPYSKPKEGKESGWSYALPVTAKDQAKVKLTLKLEDSIFYLGGIAIYSVYASLHLEIIILIFMLNVFFLGFLIAIGIEALVSLDAYWLSKEKLSYMLLMILWKVIPVVLIVFSLRPTADGMPLEESIFRLSTIQTFLLFLVLVPAACGLYYYAMLKAYETRAD
ncbi:MAG: hypothetical protein IK125_08630 [Lachnospiraceae bacterium]|nr:hypothetical protein [Lachnospiraceae bacterium]